MKLYNLIYKLVSVETSGNEVVAVISLLPESCIYSGHFPGNPITPGVVMIGIAREIAEHVSCRHLALVSVPSIKYTAILSPVEHPEVTFSMSIDNVSSGLLKLKVNVADKDAIFARMSLVAE